MIAVRLLCILLLLSVVTLASSYSNKSPSVNSKRSALQRVIPLGHRSYVTNTYATRSSDHFPSVNKIEILARDMELTEPMNFRVHSKIGKAIKKLGHNIISSHVVLRMHPFPNSGN